MFKSFWLAVMLVIGMAFTSSVMADDVSSVFTSSSCASLKNTFLDVASNKTTEDLQFSYKEAFKCNIEVLPHSIIIKLMYMVFGDFSLNAMDIAVSIIQPFFGLNIDFKSDAMASMNNIEVIDMFTTMITAVTYIVGMILAVLIGAFYVMYVVSSAQDGEVLGKGYNTLWTFVRGTFVVMLLIPLESLNNYSAVQAFSIMAAVGGTVLANLIWFLMPVFEYLHTYNTEDLKTENAYNQKSTVSDFVNLNIKMHMCDIQARKQIYTNNKRLEDLTKENIESSAFGQCLSQSSSSSIKNINNKTQQIIPSEIALTKSCAAAPQNELKYNIDCGYITLEQKDGGVQANAIADNYQSEMREVAYNLIGRYCIDNQGDRPEGDRIGYLRECADINTGTSLKYDNTTDKQILAYYNSAPSEKEIINNVNSIKNNLYNDLLKAGDSIIKTSITDDEVAKKIASSLVRGWLAASSFIIELGSSLKDRDNLFNSAFKQLSVKDNIYISGTNTTYLHSNPLTTEFNRSMGNVNAYADNILSLVNYISTVSSEESEKNNYSDGKAWYSMAGYDKSSVSDFMTTAFFPGLEYVKRFSIESEGQGVGGTQNNSCLQDFTNCPTTSLNVITDLIKLGNQMVNNAAVGLILSKGLSIVLTKYTEKTIVDEEKNAGILKPGINAFVNTLNFLSSLFFLYVILGALICYLPAIIIFVFFVGNAIGWFIVVINFVVTSQLWLLMHLLPSKGVQGFAGRAKKGYTMLLDIMIRPSFIVFGAFATFIIMSAMVSLYSVMFGMVLSTFAFFRTPGTLFEFVSNYIIHMIYLVLLLVILYRSCKSIYKIPNALQNWLNIKMYGDASAWNQIMQQFKQITVANTRNIISLKHFKLFA